MKTSEPLHPRIEFQRRERAVCTRMIGGAMAIVLGFTGISARLWWLQVRNADALAAEAAKLRLTKDAIPAQRGSILDANGQLLAQDRMLHDFYADKTHLADIQFVRPRLARLQGISQTQLRALMSEPQIITAYRQHVAHELAPYLKMAEADLLSQLMPGGAAAPVLARELLTDEAEAMQNFLTEHKIAGIDRRSHLERFRPLGDEKLLHVIGLVTKEQVKDGKMQPRKGAEGIEQRMNEVLAGVDGFEYLERDATRTRVLPGFAGQVQPAIHGRHVVLTIDMHMQQMLEECLAKGYADHKPNKIMAVIVDPATGSIRAMASEPREITVRDPKTNQEARIRRNMAATDLYEPGSTMKLITLSAGLDSGVISLDSQFYCHEGYYQESDKIWVRDDEPNGTLSVKGILAHSSNIGAYMVAKRLGQTAFYDYIKRFGVGDRTALALPGEPSGLIRPVHQWTGTSLSRVAMGYEVSVTPLQMAMVVSAIANKGKLLEPRLVESLISADRGETERLDPAVVRQVCSPRTAARITEAMEAVVTEGTGKRAALLPIRVAGKTGTAQRFNPVTKTYQAGHFVVSFVGFAPADDPKLACVVVIDDPKAADHHDLYGGKLAAPLWADIMKRALAQIGATSIAQVKASSDNE